MLTNVPTQLHLYLTPCHFSRVISLEFHSQIRAEQPKARRRNLAKRSLWVGLALTQQSPCHPGMRNNFHSRIEFHVTHSFNCFNFCLEQLNPRDIDTVFPCLLAIVQMHDSVLRRSFFGILQDMINNSMRFSQQSNHEICCSTNLPNLKTSGRMVRAVYCSAAGRRRQGRLGQFCPSSLQGIEENSFF